GALDDRRYADAYVRQRGERGHGPRRIAAELKQRGVDASVAGAALADAGHDWFTIARRVRQKKFPRGPGSLDERSKQTRFLEYRGFDSDQIRYALENSTDDEDLRN
ncbi:MAG: regulatory protein RecX, partial [Gammaproteobacteria bacterium]